METTINARLSALRELMKREKLSAFIFPSTDPHNSEWTPLHWEGRKWISGFDGSAGTTVVTLNGAALWTDSRYFIAAAEQLSGSEYVLMKERVEGTPSIAQWISEQLNADDRREVGIDGSCSSYSFVESLIHDLRTMGGITVRTNLDPLQTIWTDRPPVPTNKIVVQELQYAGEPCSEKIARIRRELRRQHADGMLVASLDDIAWALNLRGSDVHCNPVFVSYLLISTTSVTLFADHEKLTPQVLDYLGEEGIGIDEYSNVKKGVTDYSEYNILLDADEINYNLYKSVSRQIVTGASPITAMKAIKNATEIAGFRNAMLRDGVALVKFLMWLRPAVEAGGQTEMSVSDKLTGLRALQPLFKDISFDTIAGYQEHGAIVHYEATPETDARLQPQGLILIDSGAQYLDGTTDITRTISLGPVTNEQRRVYTLVLKGHIQLQLLKFPDGASGTQLDAVARKDMWGDGMNFRHGTGHGVGSYLNVHEGPHQIRMEWKPAPLHAGMTVTDEPGLYLENRFGVRTENTLLITPYKETEFGKFLQMETLTLCPIDVSPIDCSMLTSEETEWLNDYHEKVYDKLAPYLSENERTWLRNATLPI